MDKKNSNDLMVDKMVLIANLYYKSKLSQQEIARRLNISRPWVSKLLSRAEEFGIVRIEIDSPTFGNSCLEKQIKDLYDIPYVSVIDTSDASKDYVAIAAVNYFVSQVRPDDVIGVGCGNSVSRFVRELIPMHLPRTQTVPMAGSFGFSEKSMPNYIAMQFAHKLGGTSTPLHAPAFCSSKEEYDALLANEHTKKVISLAEHADIAICGIGSFTDSLIHQYKILTPKEESELKEANVLGDFTLQFIGKDGRPADTELCRRIVKADIYKVKSHARTVIGMAQGEGKAEVIKAVLTGHLMNAFFTDEATAYALLE